MVSRRSVLHGGSVASALVCCEAAEPFVLLKIAFVQDEYAVFQRGSLERFWREIWPEAARALGQCGIQLQTTWAQGHISRSPSGTLHFTDLTRGAINVVLTNH